MDFERRTTVWVGVEEAFDFFADTANLPLYVPTVRLEEAVAVDGDPDADQRDGGDASRSAASERTQ